MQILVKEVYISKLFIKKTDEFEKKFCWIENGKQEP